MFKSVKSLKLSEFFQCHFVIIVKWTLSFEIFFMHAFDFAFLRKGLLLDKSISQSQMFKKNLCGQQWRFVTLNKFPRSCLAFVSPKPQVSLPIKVVFPAQHLGGTRKALSLPICLRTHCAWLQPEPWCTVGGTTHCSSISQTYNFTIYTTLLRRDSNETNS